MALKITRRELKKRFKDEIAELKDAIKLKCFDCSGSQADGYQDCGMDDCSLYPYRLNRSMSRCSRDLRTKAGDLKAMIQGLGKG